VLIRAQTPLSASRTPKLLGVIIVQLRLCESISNSRSHGETLAGTASHSQGSLWSSVLRRIPHFASMSAASRTISKSMPERSAFLHSKGRCSWSANSTIAPIVTAPATPRPRAPNRKPQSHHRTGRLAGTSSAGFQGENRRSGIAESRHRVETNS